MSSTKKNYGQRKAPIKQGYAYFARLAQKAVSQTAREWAAAERAEPPVDVFFTGLRF